MPSNSMTRAQKKAVAAAALVAFACASDYHANNSLTSTGAADPHVQHGATALKLSLKKKMMKGSDSSGSQLVDGRSDGEKALEIVTLQQQIENGKKWESLSLLGKLAQISSSFRGDIKLAEQKHEYLTSLVEHIRLAAPALNRAGPHGAVLSAEQEERMNNERLYESAMKVIKTLNAETLIDLFKHSNKNDVHVQMVITSEMEKNLTSNQLNPISGKLLDILNDGKLSIETESAVRSVLKKVSLGSEGLARHHMKLRTALLLSDAHRETRAWAAVTLVSLCEKKLLDKEDAIDALLEVMRFKINYQNEYFSSSPYIKLESGFYPTTSGQLKGKSTIEIVSKQYSNSDFPFVKKLSEKVDADLLLSLRGPISQSSANRNWETYGAKFAKDVIVNLSGENEKFDAYAELLLARLENIDSNPLYWRNLFEDYYRMNVQPHEDEGDAIPNMSKLFNDWLEKSKDKLNRLMTMALRTQDKAVKKFTVRRLQGLSAQGQSAIADEIVKMIGDITPDARLRLLQLATDDLSKSNDFLWGMNEKASTLIDKLPEGEGCELLDKLDKLPMPPSTNKDHLSSALNKCKTSLRFISNMKILKK